MILNVRLFVLGSMTLLLASCSYKDTWEPVNVANEFTVDVPSWMEKTDDLRPGAPFQYRNRFRNVYAIVIKEKQDTLPENFSDYVSRNIKVLKNSLEAPVVADSAAVEVGGLNGVRSEVFGVMTAEKIFYTHYSLQGTNGFNYQLCVWTRGEERKLKYNNDMNRILGSFKFLAQ